MDKLNLAVSLILLGSGNLCAKSLEKMSKNLAESLSGQKGPKLAVLEVDFANGLNSEDAKVVYYRIVNALMKAKNITLIERVQLDKVMSEIKLEASGVLALDNMQKLGQLSGADFVLLTSVNKLRANELEVNSRIIETATSKVIGTDKSEIEKDWGEDDEKIEHKNAAGQAKFLKNIEDWTAEIDKRKLSGAYSKGYYGRGVNYFGIKEYNSAIVDFTRAISIGDLDYPDLPLAYYYLGRAKGYRKQYAEAIGFLKSALALNVPSFAEVSAREVLTSMYQLSGDYPATIKSATEGLQLFPNNQLFFALRAGAYLALSDYDNAIRDTTKAMELGADKKGSYNRLAWIYFDTGRYVLALEYFNKQALLYQTTNPDVSIGLALANYKMGNILEAKKYFTEAVKLDKYFDGRFDSSTDYFYSKVQIEAMKELYRKLN